MGVGRIFNLEGVAWMVDEIIPQENKCHRWLKVVYSWSCFGPRPVFADKQHFLIVDKVAIGGRSDVCDV